MSETLNPRVHAELLARGFHKHTHIEENYEVAGLILPAYDLYEGIGEYVAVTADGIQEVERRDLNFEMWHDKTAERLNAFYFGNVIPNAMER